MSPSQTPHPFTAFNFKVEINVPNQIPEVCNAAFSDCDGLELTMEVKTIREGGNNARQIRLTGPTSFGSLTLKRGMTDNYDLWDWFTAVQRTPTLRANAEVVLLSADGKSTLARFLLDRCLPIKLKAPPMNAREGAVAIEELQVAYETITFVKPT